MTVIRCNNVIYYDHSFEYCINTNFSQLIKLHKPKGYSENCIIMFFFFLVFPPQNIAAVAVETEITFPQVEQVKISRTL